MCLVPVNLLPVYNSAVKRLKEERCGMQCGNEIAPGLLFADGTCLVALNVLGIMRSLDVLVEWCKEWGVKINVTMSGTTHICKKAE